jgi:hypothetical protein
MGGDDSMKLIAVLLVMVLLGFGGHPAGSDSQPQTGSYSITDQASIQEIAPLFKENSYFVIGEKAYNTDVLGTAKISYGLALGGAQNPEGRTDMIITNEEKDEGNLIIVGGPAINPAATEFGGYFGISYDYEPNASYEIFCERNSIYLDLTKYPHEDICIIYLGQFSSRNVLLVWGYGW